MGRVADDLATPFEHLHDAEGARFRHWRDRHRDGTWDAYQREKHVHGSLETTPPHEPQSRGAEQRVLAGVVGVLVIVSSIVIGDATSLLAAVPVGLGGLGIILCSGAGTARSSAAPPKVGRDDRLRRASRRPPSRSAR